MNSQSSPSYGIPSGEDVFNVARSIVTLGASKAHPEVIAQARNTVKSYVAACNRAIADFNCALNELTPVGQLPIDVLSQIMITVSKSLYQDYINAEGHYLPSDGEDEDSESSIYGENDDEFVRLTRGPRAWMVVAQVCRSWRRLALATPALWANIYKPNHRSLPELLSRSRQAPLCITLRRVQSPELVMSIAREAHRIREIDLRCPASHLEQFCAALDDGANQLQHLVLSAADRGWWERDVMSETIVECTAKTLPRLRFLEVHALLISWRDTIFSSRLHTLIYDPTTRGDQADWSQYHPSSRLGTFAQFMLVLESLAATLEVLRLEDCIPPLSVGDSYASASTQAITFTRLRECVILTGTEECAYIFRRISLPRTACNICLYMRDERRGLEDILSKLGGYFSHRNSPPLTVVNIYCHGSAMNLNGWVNETTRGDGRCTNLQLRNLCAPEGNRPDRSTFPLQTLAPLCTSAFAGLRALGLHCDGKAINVKWSTILAWVPELRELLVRQRAPRTAEYLGNLEGSHTPNDLHDALMCSRDPHTGKPITPVPFLKDLEFSFPEGTLNLAGSALASGLRICLQSRSEAGVPLARLSIKGTFNDVNRTHIEELRSWAGEVTWVKWQQRWDEPAESY